MCTTTNFSSKTQIISINGMHKNGPLLSQPSTTAASLNVAHTDFSEIFDVPISQQVRYAHTIRGQLQHEEYAYTYKYGVD